MHKMHKAEEFLCRYDGACERKQPGNGFARSFNRGDHEKRVHHMFQENTRSKGRPKGAFSETSNAHASKRRKLSHHDGNCVSDESSTSTIGAAFPASPKPRLQKHPAPVNVPRTDPSMDYILLAGGTNVGCSFNSMMQNQAQVHPGFPGTKRTRCSKPSVKSNTRGAGQTSKKRSDHTRRWGELVHVLRNLVSNLPDDPNDSLGHLVQSIYQEAYELLRLHNNPRHMDDHELRLLPTQSFSW